MPKSDIPIETLIEQLHGEDWIARCDAARLLGQSRDPRAVDALLPDLNDSDWRVRRNAAQALGALRDKRAVEPLIHALKDRTMTVRQRAIVALGRIKDPQALPFLLDIFLEDRYESYDANKAILKFGKKALPEVIKTYEKTNSQKLMMLLIEMKYDGALGLILKLLESPEAIVRLKAIQELGKLGDKKAIPPLISQLNTSDPLIQSEAVRALGMLSAVETIPVLLDLLVDYDLYGPRSSLYHAVTQAFQNFGGITEEIKNAFPGNYPPMFNMGGASLSLPEAMGLLGNTQPNMLHDALSKLHEGQAEPVDIPDLPSDIINEMFETMQWKFGVMFADARDAKQDRVTRLVELLKSELSLTRAAAALTLSWYGDDRALEFLRQLTKDQDETVHIAATWAYNTLQKTIEQRKQFGL
ncbi:MAG TPA: HEAT repeat domain-containing protein [Anaerolineales bacterium]|nr:HEAT repeat domain-containing protein [Anaerolineales bacterium]